MDINHAQNYLMQKEKFVFESSMVKVKVSSKTASWVPLGVRSSSAAGKGNTVSQWVLVRLLLT
jgi:hypothetical protein